jgi:hypothetical protein
MSQPPPKHPHLFSHPQLLLQPQPPLLPQQSKSIKIQRQLSLPQFPFIIFSSYQKFNLFFLLALVCIKGKNIFLYTSQYGKLKKFVTHYRDCV